MAFFVKHPISLAWISFFDEFFTDCTMGFITIFHHHLGDAWKVFVGILNKQNLSLAHSSHWPRH